MTENSTIANVLSIISIGIAAIAVVSAEYRFVIGGVFAVALFAYYLSTIYGKVEQNTESIKKLKEKIQIYQELVTIKADIKSLKERCLKKMNKRGISDKEFLSFIATIAALILLYVIYKALVAKFGGG